MLPVIFQTYSMQALRDLSLPFPSQQSAHIFSFSDAFFFFLSTLTYCILNVGLEYKYIFLVALFLFFLNFPDGHSFPSSET